MLHSKKIDLQNYINLRLVIRPEEFWASFPIDGKLVINEGGAAEAVCFSLLFPCPVLHSIVETALRPTH